MNLLTATSRCVEVLNLGNRQWSTAICIPELRTPQAMCCGETVYLSSYASDSLYSCQIQDLLQSVEEIEAMKKVSSLVWTKMQSLPSHCKASITAFGGHMIAVGGENEEGKDMKLIYCYDRESNWWTEIGEMPTARKFVLTGVLPDARIVCVGGQSEAANNVNLRVVEIGQIKKLAVKVDPNAMGQARSSCGVM